jgi:hypothetical protein
LFCLERGAGVLCEACVLCGSPVFVKGGLKPYQTKQPSTTTNSNDYPQL